LPRAGVFLTVISDQPPTSRPSATPPEKEDINRDGQDKRDKEKESILFIPFIPVPFLFSYLVLL
jgi:hypothetical protein